MAYAIPIAVLFVGIALMSLVDPAEIFSQETPPLRTLPLGRRDPREAKARPARSLRPVPHGPYGVPERMFAGSEVPADGDAGAPAGMDTMPGMDATAPAPAPAPADDAPPSPAPAMSAQVQESLRKMETLLSLL